MAIFYNDHRGSSFTGSTATWDGTKAYLKHYENFLTLDFIAKASTDGKERAQARHELEICQRKLSYWKKHQNYDQAAATKGVAKLKAMWEQR